MGEIATTVVGAGFLVIGWIAPMMIHDLPYSLQILLLAFGGLLVVTGIVLAFRKHKQKQASSSGINVRMRDHNTVGQIGDSYGRE